MPLLFSVLEHYNLLSKQPNYTCGLFFSDLMFMIVSWARAVMSISKKAWTFPGRAYYYILYFQKLIESPTTVRPKEERDKPGPGDSLEGKSCLADSFLLPWPCPRDNLEGKSCLANSFLIPWPCPRDNLEGKSCLADSFLKPAAPEGTYWAPGAAPWGRAALQVPLLSRDLVTVWAHPGGSRHTLSHFSRVRLFATLWTVARQAPLSMGFSGQEYWSGLPCPAPVHLLDPGMEPTSLTSTCIGRRVLYH